MNNIAAIRNMKPIDRLAYWIRERESIRLQKEAGEPKPWTRDPLLLAFRFCNVRRMDDKVSQWLLKNWYEPYFNHPNMLAAVAVARFINLPQSLVGLSLWLLNDEKTTDVNWKEVKTFLRSVKQSEGKVFNGAYMVRGNDGSDKIECVIDHYVRPMLHQMKKWNYGVNTETMEGAWDQLSECYGFGSFMAGQVVADLRWAMKGKWEDRNTWAPVGPGSARGLARLLFESDWKVRLKEVSKQETFRQLLISKVIPQLKERLPKSITDRLEAHDYQNTLCESDKYNRVLFGEGQPKQKYNGAA